MAASRSSCPSYMLLMGIALALYSLSDCSCSEYSFVVVANIRFWSLALCERVIKLFYC